jgi:surface antigen
MAGKKPRINEPKFLLVGPVAFFVLIMALPAGAHLRKAHSGLDPQTHKEINAAMQIALETHLSGRSLPWASANSNYTGRITPVRTWRSRSGHFCCAFVEIIRLPSGVERNSRASACRNVAGRWVRI